MKLAPCSFEPSLTFEEAQNLSPNFSPAATLPEKTSEISLGHFGSLTSFRTDFLFAYDIFPRFLMRPEAQWIRERRTMRIGDILCSALFCLLLASVFVQSLLRASRRLSANRVSSVLLMRRSPGIWSAAYRSPILRSVLEKSFLSSTLTRSLHIGFHG
jgi:hypothetical protein